MRVSKVMAGDVSVVTPGTTIDAAAQMMADLDIEPLRNLQQAVQDLYILASPQSPMRDLLAGITRQLMLTQPPPPPPGVAGAVQGATQAATAAATQAAGTAANRLSGPPADELRAALWSVAGYEAPSPSVERPARVA